MSPYLVLLPMGFAVPVRYRTRGALLPHHFTLTTHPKAVRRYLSVALSVDSHRPGVTWHRALRSPDFPRRHKDAAIAWPTPDTILSEYEYEYEDSARQKLEFELDK